jgi:hypothetical protein
MLQFEAIDCLHSVSLNFLIFKSLRQILQNTPICLEILNRKRGIITNMVMQYHWLNMEMEQVEASLLIREHSTLGDDQCLQVKILK